ncbi:MAG: type II secretion system F family protein [Candidatus Omnitrophica bacterium]|nr:type II secretion system F family protein [Candidatus Omnitrophota bacterium]
MLIIVLVMIYIAVLTFILGCFPPEWEERPTLNAFGEEIYTRKQRKSFTILTLFGVINKPVLEIFGDIKKQLNRDLAVARLDLSPEEFMVVQEVTIGVLLVVLQPIVKSDMVIFYICVSLAGGYMLPRIWLNGKIRAVKNVIVKELPDAIDLLALCVNAGLDFMLALRWVVEKSPPSLMMTELNNLLQEINIGKTRRDAIRDLAFRYQLPDLSTFSRTLIQADKMGTSVTEALNILSEDMRLSRFRRGEQMALKAPMKMLIPLLLFIFPVVGILVAGPILLDFIENNPFKAM